MSEPVWRRRVCVCGAEVLLRFETGRGFGLRFDPDGRRHRCGRDYRQCACGGFLYTRVRDGAVLEVSGDRPHACMPPVRPLTSATAPGVSPAAARPLPAALPPGVHL